MTPRVGGFIEKHPEIDLELLSTNALTDFTRDDVDVAIRFGSGKYAGLHAEKLLDEVFFPACSPNFNGGKLPRTPADLADAPLLRSNDELWRPWFDAAGLTGLSGAQARRAIRGFVEFAAGGHRRPGNRARAPLARDA